MATQRFTFTFAISNTTTIQQKAVAVTYCATSGLVTVGAAKNLYSLFMADMTVPFRHFL
jgi:hypothetical protein